MEMTIQKMPSSDESPEAKHAMEIDRLKQQCSVCKLNRPNTPTKDCDIKIKLTIKDSEIAWKHKHLFISQGRCKMFKMK